VSRTTEVLASNRTLQLSGSFGRDVQHNLEGLADHIQVAGV
jgi:hypothetical protein